MGFLIMGLGIILMAGSSIAYFRWYQDRRTEWALLTYVFSWLLMTFGVWMVVA
jgi:hypothetical protein